MAPCSKLILVSVFVFVVASLPGCRTAKPRGVVIERSRLGMFKPLPPAVESPENPLTEEKVTLGRMLYFEPRLSLSHTLSCNSCHGLNTYGVDGQPVSDGHKGAKGSRNSPTVYNAAGHVAQFWDGRAPTVEEQARGPVLNPVEMAMTSEGQVVEVLNSMPEYVEAFQRAFPGKKNPVTFENVTKAIGAFERKLISPARWDRFLAGDEGALTDAEKEGFNRFMETGCQGCHNSPYLGGQMFQKLGVEKPWPDNKDLGRFAITKQEADKMVFKVPSLRNVAKTAPYYHDGSVRTLWDAVGLMAEYQLGKRLRDDEVAAIVTWLNSLTGELPVDYIKPPVLPKSTSKTPKPHLM